MRTRLYILILLAALSLGLVQPAAAQTSLTETTVAQAVTASQPFVVLTSATGVSPGYGIYIDRELMTVAGDYVSGTRVPVVRRGVVTSHAAGVGVYIAPAPAFVTGDRYGSCTAASEAYSPVINTNNGNIWECNSVVKKWVNLRDLVVVTCRTLLAADQIDQSCFTANRQYVLYKVTEIHTTAEATAGSLTITIRKQVGTQAVASGTDLLASTINGKGTAQTLQTGSLTTTEANLIINTGDRLGLDFTGSATELAGVTVTLFLYPL